MKEFLEKQANGEYVLIEAYRKGVNDWIEVPDGAELYAYWPLNRDKSFHSGKSLFEDGAWICSAWDVEEIKTGAAGAEVLWQRPQQPESLPFIDDEVQSINDKYAEIEQVRQQSIDATLAERQSTYGSFEDVAFVTENIINVLKKCNYDEMPHTHRMAMYMIASKMARLVNGDFNHLDSWHDIGGYAKLIENLIKENNNG